MLILGIREVHGDAKTMLERLPVRPQHQGGIRFFHESAATRSWRGRSSSWTQCLAPGFIPHARPGSCRPKLLERYAKTPVVAVDLPSGWDADSREFLASESTAPTR